MSTNLQPDAVHGQDSYHEIQHLTHITAKNKEEFEYNVMYLGKKIAELSTQIRIKRIGLLGLIKKYDIEPTSFPVLGQILSDDVYPDTEAAQNMGTVDVEKAMRKNIPDQLFDLLKTKIKTSVHHEINDRIDEIKKLKLHKAQLEGDMLAAQQAVDSYFKNDAVLQDNYKSIRKDLENLTSLFRSLGEFGNMFHFVPQDLTTDAQAKSHDSNVDKFSPYYVGRKKAIKLQSDKIQETFGDVFRYVGVSTVLPQEDILSTLREISKYFGEPGETKSLDVLPAQYVDAYPISSIVEGFVDKYITQVNAIMGYVKAALDALRNSTGTGNKEIDDLAIDAKAKADHPEIYGRKLDQSTLTDIQEVNRIQLSSSQQKVNSFKAIVAGGSVTLTPAFIQNHSDAIVRMTLQGYPVASNRDRKTVLEAAVREKVRKKFGHLPFCDETIVTDSIGATTFVKKSELHTATGQKLSVVQGRQVQKAAMNAAKAQ